jgi:hypothetical protein
MAKTESQFTINWVDFGREPQCASDPKYPRGIDIDLRSNSKQTHCRIPLPYPAKRCGLYNIICKNCGLNIALTTAGRADDPRSVTMACKLN